MGLEGGFLLRQTTMNRSKYDPHAPNLIGRKDLATRFPCCVACSTDGAMRASMPLCVSIGQLCKSIVKVDHLIGMGSSATS